MYKAEGTAFLPTPGLMQVATALAEGFLPYCQGVHQRCVTMIQAAVLQQDMAAQGAAEEPEGTFFVVPLDLLSAVAEAIGPSVETLVSQTPILYVKHTYMHVYRCMCVCMFTC